MFVAPRSIPMAYDIIPRYIKEIGPNGTDFFT
jgi:hypothetical protein